MEYRDETFYKNAAAFLDKIFFNKEETTQLPSNKSEVSDENKPN